jgi:anti-sigma-K factor RskA
VSRKKSRVRHLCALEQTRALVEAEQQHADAERQRAEAQATAKNRLTWRVVALAIIALFAVAMAYRAILQRQNAMVSEHAARQARQIAEERRIGLSSTEEMPRMLKQLPRRAGR